jgi:hypothetical protein
MSKTAPFHRTDRRRYTNDNKNINEKPSLGSVLKESFAVGTGVTAANEIVSRIFSSVLGPRKVEVIQEDNKCKNYLEEHIKCMKENSQENCKSYLEVYETCLRGN